HAAIPLPASPSPRTPPTSIYPLSLHDALPIFLVAIGSLSYEEIADICGIALGTVKSRICRARAMLSHVLNSGQLPDFRHNFVLRDRKSTRLNSSHVKISYAVFCLKKKRVRDRK